MQIMQDNNDTNDLRVRLAAQEADLAAQRAELTHLRATLTARRGYRWRRLVPVMLVTLLVALVPLATLAAGPFADLNPSSPHNTNIQAIAEAGITNGCDPGVAYCPNGNVTREEMASFLARAAGLGTNPPVANAKTAQTAQTAQNAFTAQSAVSAQTATNATEAQNAANAAHATNADTAATIGGYTPSALGRVAFSNTLLHGNLPNNGTVVEIARVTITIPGPSPQAVVVRGAFHARGQMSNGFILAQVGQDGSVLTGSLSYPYVVNSTTVGISPSSQALYIAQPGTHTYTLYGRATDTNGQLTLHNPTLIVTTHPFGPEGIPGTGVIAPQP